MKNYFFVIATVVLFVSFTFGQDVPPTEAKASPSPTPTTAVIAKPEVSVSPSPTPLVTQNELPESLINLRTKIAVKLVEMQIIKNIRDKKPVTPIKVSPMPSTTRPGLDVPTMSVTKQEDKKPEKCSVSASKTVGFYTSYDGLDVGSRFHPSRVFQGDIDLEFCGNKKISYGFNQWWSLSSKENPSSGSETDAIARITFKLPKETTLTFDGGVFVVEGGEIYKAGVALSKDIEFKKVNLSVSNSTTAYWIGRLDTNGGFVNKTQVPISKEFNNGKWSLTITPAVSFDNNPFGLGAGKFVSMGFLTGRVDIPINDRVTFFVTGTQYWKNFGNSDRGQGRVGGFGFTIRIK